MSVLAVIIGAAMTGAEPLAVAVSVTLVDYRFEPDHLNFQRGVRYRLHLENRGTETHEFTAPAFFATAEIGNPDALNSERTEAVVAPGQSKDILLTPQRPGLYDLRCSDHDWAGMTGDITVE